MKKKRKTRCKCITGFSYCRITGNIEFSNMKNHETVKAKPSTDFTEFQFCPYCGKGM